MPLYFINPRKSSRRRKGRVGKLFGAAKAAFLRRMAKGRRKKARPTRAKRTRRVVRSPHHGVSPMAKRRRRARRATTRRRRRRPVARRSAPRRSRRRRASAHRRRRSGSGVIRFRRVRGSVYSRNPAGLSIGNIKRTLIQGAKDAAAVVAGEAVVNFVGRKLADKLPGEPSMAKTLAMRAALAIGVGIAATKVAGRRAAEFAVAGALASPVKTLLRSVIPADSEIATALASDEELGAYYSEVGAYVDNPIVQRIGPGGRDRTIGALGEAGQWDGEEANVMAGMY